MAQENKSTEMQVLHANAIFATNLYKILSKQEGNIFFSPFNVHSILSMLYHGAEGETAQVLLHALKSTDAEGYRTVMDHLNSTDRVKLMMANKIYGNKNNETFLQKFEDILKNNFNSEFEFLDMSQKTSSAKTVNDWVESKTNNMIQNIVNENTFNENLSLLLVNAIYFKGFWASQFQASSTKKAEFFIDKDKPVEVQMMYQKSKYGYKLDKELDAQIIEVPYVGLSTSMLIILPLEDSSIKQLEEKLVNHDLMKVWENLETKDVRFYLPKFKMEETLKLNNILIEMGLGDIFDMRRANFGKMLKTKTPSNNLYVSEIIQKAFIKVDEAGTEAAAATRASMMVGCAPVKIEPVTFKVNRPAIFMLLSSHGKAKNVLFYGRLTRPQC